MQTLTNHRIPNATYRKVQLGSISIEFCVHWNMICDAEEHMDGGNMMDLAMRGSIGFLQMRALLLGLCYGQHGITTIEEAGNFLQKHIAHFTTLSLAFAEVLTECFPAQGDESGNPS